MITKPIFTLLTQEAEQYINVLGEEPEKEVLVQILTQAYPDQVHWIEYWYENIWKEPRW